MKNIKLLLIAFIQISFAYSQSIRLFDSGTRPLDMIQTSDGNILTMITYKVYKIDVYGNTIWESDSLPYGILSRVHRLFEIPGGNIIAFMGQNMYTLSPEGDLLAGIDYSDLYSGWDVCSVNDGFQLYGGDFPGDESYTIFKILNDGSASWNSEQLTDNYYNRASCMFEEDGVTTVMREIIDPWIWDWDTIHIEQFDSLGNLLFSNQRKLNCWLNGITRVNGGALEYGCTRTFDQYYLSKITNAGDIEWEIATNPVNGIFVYDSLMPVMETWNNNYVRAFKGIDTVSHTEFYYLQYFNSEGDSIFAGPRFLETNFDFSNYNITKFMQVDENSFAYFGSCGTYGFERSFYMLTDSIGTMLNLTIEGRVYYDENANETFDIGEVNFQNIFIQTTPIPFYAVTDSSGYYVLNLFTPEIYTNECVLPEYWDLAEPTAYTSELNIATSGEILTGYDYQLSYSTPITEISATLYDAGVYPGDTSYSTITVNNFGNQTLTAGTITLRYPSITTLIYSEPMYASYDDTTITWEFSDLDPFEVLQFKTHYVTPYDTTLIGTSYQFITELGAIPEDINATNNADTFQRVIVLPYDPNHKTVSPEGVGENGATDPSTEWLQYSIEFQNVGNAPAINVSIVDTIDIDFELTSLQMLASSHNYTMEINAPNIVTWHFNNINLPDSADNLLGSMGFIQYRIKLNETSGIGTQLSNSAAVYFDLNDPVITNTTLNTLEEQQAAVEEEFLNNMFSIYPNPAGDELTIQFNSQAKRDCKIELFDLSGKKIRSEYVLSYELIMNIATQTLLPGLYFLKITDMSDHNSETESFIKN